MPGVHQHLNHKIVFISLTLSNLVLPSAPAASANSSDALYFTSQSCRRRACAAVQSADQLHPFPCLPPICFLIYYSYALPHPLSPSLLRQRRHEQPRHPRLCRSREQVDVVFGELVGIHLFSVFSIQLVQRSVVREHSPTSTHVPIQVLVQRMNVLAVHSRNHLFLPSFPIHCHEVLVDAIVVHGFFEGA